MKREKFFEYCFRGLTLLFWPIIIYRLIFLPNYKLEYIMIVPYSILAILYIIIIGILQIKNKFLDNIIVYYRISTLISFILTLASLMLYPTNLTLMMLKLLSVIIYFYISSKSVYTYHLEECVVGIISSVLIFAIAIL